MSIKIPVAKKPSKSESKSVAPKWDPFTEFRGPLSHREAKLVEAGGGYDPILSRVAAKSATIMTEALRNKRPEIVEMTHAAEDKKVVAKVGAAKVVTRKNAYDAGWNKGRRGLPQDNPYPANLELWNAWAKGYIKGDAGR